MGMAPGEVQRRRRSDASKYSKTPPIAAIEKRVIDSEAFADLPPSAIVVLLLLARNLDKGQNGHIWLKADKAAQHGINEKTLYRQLKTLIAHGFICQTRRGGNGVCARYALTWLPMTKDTKGLQVDHFQSCAWRNWRPTERKNATVKMSVRTGQKYRSGRGLADKKGASPPDKNTDVEFNTNTVPDAAMCADAWTGPYLANLEVRGLGGCQCFVIPPRLLQ